MISTIFSKYREAFLEKSDGKLGAIRGVFIPNVLQMIGVILFMRLGYICGHVGITSTLTAISLASTILILTSFSMASIVSNMKVGSGGAYYILSRLLGVEFGSAVGILLCISQHASIALCVTGFSLSIHQFFPDSSLLLIEAISLTVLIGISYISTNLAVKAQGLIFCALAIAIGSIFFSSSETIDPKLFEVEFPLAALSFWAAFSMFFPAVTGIEAGMSMSGDLKNPNRALPIATLASVITAFVLYSSLAIFLNSHVSSEMLRAHPFMVYHMSKFKYLIMIGVWGATLSSALGSVLGAPRVLQALAKDRVIPKFLAKGDGETNQPRRATLFVFFTAMCLTLATDINQIIPIMTMICLTSYSLLNFVAFFESFIRNPSWRPGIFIHWIIPLIGMVGCITAMFLINFAASLIVICMATLLCIITSRRNIEGGFEDIRYGLFSYLVHKGAAKLGKMTPNAKSWRPSILALIDLDNYCKSKLLFSNSLDQGKGFLTFAMASASRDTDEKHEAFRKAVSELKIPAFFHLNRSEPTAENLVQQVKSYGFGPLVPNSILIQLDANREFLYQSLIDAHQIQKNFILFKSAPDSSSLFTVPSPKRIHLWWKGGNQNNFELCLALSYSLSFNPTWSQSEIVIRSLLDDPLELEKLTHLFTKYKEKMRIKTLAFEPILREPGCSFGSVLQEVTHEADFTFLGLRFQGKEESVEQYHAYLDRFFEMIQCAPNCALVLAGEKLSFKRIFT